MIQPQVYQPYDIAQRIRFEGRSVDDIRQRHHHLLQLLDAHFTESKHFFQSRKDIPIESVIHHQFQKHSISADSTLAKKMQQVLFFLAFRPNHNTQCNFDYGPYIVRNLFFMSSYHIFIVLKTHFFPHLLSKQLFFDVTLEAKQKWIELSTVWVLRSI